MRIGLYINGGASLDALLARVRAASAAGLDSAFFSQITAWDAITVAALAARETPGIEVGTAVVQTYPRHPLALAGQALTAQTVSGNRLTLGIGPSHRPIVEGLFGLSYDRPARHTREYLTALRPLLRGEAVEYRGETLSVTGRVDVPGAAAPPVLLAALGPVMLRIAGELADGTITIWTGPEAIADHVAPRIVRAAESAGRPAPRVVACVPMSLTGDPDGVRQAVGERLGFAGDLASYRSMLDRQGMSGVHETVVAGDEGLLARAVGRYAAAGTTDLLISPAGDPQEQTRTIAYLASLPR